jgi:hypothetical protein
MGRAVVGEVARIGGEVVLRKDAVGRSAVGYISPFLGLFRCVHQPRGILAPYFDRAPGRAGIDVDLLRQYVSVDQAMGLPVRGLRGDGNLRERREARVRHRVIVTARGQRDRQRDRKGAGQVGVFFDFEFDDVGVEILRGGVADDDVEEAAHQVLGPIGIPTRSAAASASGAGLWFESHSCQKYVGSFR